MVILRAQRFSRVIEDGFVEGDEGDCCGWESWIEVLFAIISGCPQVYARGAPTGLDRFRGTGREVDKACNRAWSK